MPRSFPIFFTQKIEPDPFQGGFGSNLESPVMDFSNILGSVVLSFSPSTPKLVNFPNFLTCTSLRKTCQHQKFEKKNMSTTPKLVNFPHSMDLHEFEKNMSTPKLVNFPHFLDSRSLRKKHVNTKTSQFSPFYGLARV